MGAGSIVGGLGAGAALLPGIAAAALAIGAAFVVGKYTQDAYDKWGKGLTDFLGDTGRWWGSEIYDWLHPNHANFIADLQSKFQQAEVTRSPLILDLDGDGVETIGKSAGIHFDHDANRFSETTGWVGKDDGLLVWDRDGNGEIDDGGELFGNKTKLADGNNAANGFAALTELDSNHDGVIDASDAEFGRLRVWKDADSNAIVSDGELLSLEAVGVKSIKLAYVQQNTTDAQGNQHLQIGQYTRVDGSTRAMDDVWFAADMARTTDMNTVAIANDIAALPDLQGFGNVSSLHQAMARDTTGKLQAMLNQFIAEPDATTRSALMKDLIYVWAGVDNIDPTSRAATLIYGNVVGDARKLATLEAFLGEGYLGTWCWGERDANPHGQAAPILLEAFDQLEARFSSELAAQTHLKYLYDSVELTWDLNSLAISVDVSKALDKILALYDADPEAASSTIKEFATGLKSAGDFGAQTIAALRTHGNLDGTGLSLLLAVAGAEFMLGDSGNDALTANAGQDTAFMGMGGNDRLNGNSGDDILNGGTGNDSLNGGTGNDTYVFARGDGVDIVTDYDTTSGNIDVVQFMDVAATELPSVERRGNDLMMQYGPTDQLTVSRYFDPGNPGQRIERFSFSDGVSWDDAEIKARAITMGSTLNDYISGNDDSVNRINGLDGNDLLYGGSEADIVDGGAGNDTLYGRAGDDALYGGAGKDELNGEAGADLIIGGTGDDMLWGGTGNDTYVIARGDGVDTISDYDPTAGNTDVVQFTDVASTELASLERKGDHLVLKYGASDQLTLKDYFYTGSSGYKVEQFSFSDGVNWDEAAVKARVMTSGSMTNDYIAGYADGSNRIYGFDGNDYLAGGSRGDLIDGGDGIDTLTGGAGDDQLYGGAGNDVLNDSSGNNLFDGGANDDTLSGGTGNELFIGGAGDDFISTGSGYDIIAFNKGDGRDTVAASTGRDNTLSLGGGISDVDLLFSRSANDLVLATGGNEQITFKDWYAGTGNHSVANLQIAADAGSGDDATVLAQFDFNGLASRFDEAQAADPAITRWALTSSMMAFHLGSCDAAALGGELAYQYASHGAVGELSASFGQSQLGSAQFGVSSQAVNNGPALQNTVSRLI